MNETLLSKRLALPIFASDPLSSVAYATEAALVVLIAASATAGHLVLPISIAIAAVLAIVVVSYMQTVRAYETSGGAYVVARENLGTMPSLVAAAALLVDYILTVAVSVAAGVLALTSAAPSLAGHEVDALASPSSSCSRSSTCAASASRASSSRFRPTRSSRRCSCWSATGVGQVRDRRLPPGASRRTRSRQAPGPSASSSSCRRSRRARPR